MTLIILKFASLPATSCLACIAKAYDLRAKQGEEKQVTRAGRSGIALLVIAFILTIKFTTAEQFQSSKNQEIAVNGRIAAEQSRDVAIQALQLIQTQRHEIVLSRAMAHKGHRHLKSAT